MARFLRSGTQWPVDNVQFDIIYQAIFVDLAVVSKLTFHQKLNSLEFFKPIYEDSSPQGSFRCNKRKFEFLVLSSDSPY